MKFARAAILAICVLALAPVHAAELMIGVAGPMTGPLSDAGKAMASGALMAAKDINARGGITGATILPVIENDEASLAGARRVAETFAAKNLKIVLGHYTSAPTLTAMDVYGHNGVLLIAPTATAPKLTARKDWNVLRLAPREDAQGLFAGEALAAEFPNGRIAIIQDGSPMGRVLAAAVKSVLRRKGLENMTETDIPAGASDGPLLATRQAQRLAEEKSDAIYWAGNASNALAFIKALRGAGSTAVFLASDALATPEFAGAADDGIENLHVTILADVARADAAKDVAARLRADGVKDIPLALSTYASMQVIERAANSANSTDPSRIAKAMRAGPAVNTVIGAVSFDANGERSEQQFIVAAWKKAADGKFILTPL